MARKPTEPNWLQCRFAWFLVSLGIGAEAVRRAGYARANPRDYGSKLVRKPHVLILALRLDERRRLAADAVKSLSNSIKAVIDNRRVSPEQQEELVRHYERLGSLPHGHPST